MTQPEINDDEVRAALRNLSRYHQSLHKAFISAALVAAISTLAAVSLAIDKWL